ncbi:hypothetical protein NM688_g2123 [Phlebia brevispora]|uniref:Uncharacterized protein n=1 Tax=Phlebia brevispora TaxID=194682 RepID=A0ACC1T9R6_9APHY|nr:hypothetical protein NM688_g2123 [Phlebia brevispora]
MSVANPETSTSPANAPLPSTELEQTLSLLTSNRTVLGYVLLSRGQPATIIRHSGVIFDGEQGKKYAGVISRVVEGVQTGLDELSSDAQTDKHHAQDELRFMRIRTKRHEIMISPGMYLVILRFTRSLPCRQTRSTYWLYYMIQVHDLPSMTLLGPRAAICLAGLDTQYSTIPGIRALTYYTSEHGDD